MASPRTSFTGPERLPVRRALISVSDKTGLVQLATALQNRGAEIVSTGGTAAALVAGGIKVTDVAEVTGFPEMMDGRVKTLHPKIHGGLLALRDDPGHAAAMQQHCIGGFDLLVGPATALPPLAAGALAGRGYLTTLARSARRVPFTQAWNLAGLPAVEGSARDTGAPLDERGAGLADEPGSTAGPPGREDTRGS